MRLLVDLDEVLADFRGGACRVHMVDRHEADKLAVESENWDMASVWGITEEEFWKPITEAGAAFWEGLKPLPWAEELMEIVKEKTEDWFIVTSPSRCETSYLGKLRWLRKQLGSPYFNRVFITSHKYALAGPETILIDDREKNVAEFIMAGGDGIIFPSIGNKLRHLRLDPVKYVRAQLL